MTERKTYIDYIKAIGIILVVIGHINFANEPFKELIYSFHMPLFFFANGLVTRNEKIKIHVSKRFYSIIIPYFLWALIYASFDFKKLLMICYGSYSSIQRAGSLSSLWFLPTLLVSGMIVQFINKILKNDIEMLVGGVACFIIAVILPPIDYGYPWCFDVALLVTFFIVLGSILVKHLNNVGWLHIVIMLLCGFAGLALNLFNPLNDGSYILVAAGRTGNPLLFLFTALGGCIAVTAIGLMLSKIKREIRILSFIGKNTLVIFAVHKPIINVFEVLFSHYHINMFAELFVTTILTVLVSCVVSMLVNSFLPVLAGKTKKININ